MLLVNIHSDVSYLLGVEALTCSAPWAVATPCALSIGPTWTSSTTSTSMLLGKAGSWLWKSVNTWSASMWLRRCTGWSTWRRCCSEWWETFWAWESGKVFSFSSASAEGVTSGPECLMETFPNEPPGDTAEQWTRRHRCHLHRETGSRDIMLSDLRHAQWFSLEISVDLGSFSL